MSFRRHEDCIDSGVAWLGDVPSYWNVVRLRRLVEIKKDIAGELGYDVFSVTQNGFRIKDTESGEGQQSLDYSKYQFVRVGQFGMNPMDLLTGGADIATTDGVTSPDYRVFEIRNVEEVHDRYMLYMLQMLYRNHIFYAFGQGSSQLGRWRLPRQQFNDFQLPVPPLDEQKAISSFLDVETSKIDGLVSEQRRLIELLKEKRQAVISHAVTKGLNPDVKMKPSGIQWLGDVPEHWKEYPLKALMSLKHGYAFDGAGFSPEGESILMTPGNFLERGGYRPKTTEKYYEGDDIPEEYVLQSGQLLVAMTEQAPGLLGSALFVPDHGVFLHNQRIGLIVGLRRDILNEKFLFHLFNSIRYRAEVSVTSTGSKVKHTSSQRMLSVKVCLPPLAEQEEIASVVDEKTELIDQLEADAERAIELLQERRTALISAAVTGKIDVRNYAPVEAV